MDAFNKTFEDIRSFLDKRKTRSWQSGTSKKPWPDGGSRNIVLGSDMCVELGNPKSASSSCIIWSEDLDRIKDNTITLVGPDIQQSKGKSLPFAKIVLLGTKPHDEADTYSCYREMERIRYTINLKGYMLRGAYQYQNEWCRINKKAFKHGFNFDVLGTELIRKMKEIEFVESAEVIFVTSSSEDVNELDVMTKNVGQIINAMNKMASDLTFDCDECEYQEVCEGVGELKTMRDSLKEKKEAANE